MTEQMDWRAKQTSPWLASRKIEVLRNSRHYLRAQSPRHHSIDRLEERGVKRGSTRRSSLKGRDRAIVNQTNTGTVSKSNVGETPETG